MSFNVAFRRSPKPGAFTAADCSVPRNRLTTRVASSSPSMSSEMINNLRLRLGKGWRPRVAANDKIVAAVISVVAREQCRPRIR